MDRRLVDELRLDFERRSEPIRTLIRSFERKYKKCGDCELFDELVYVILAAGSSAESALRGAQALKGIYRMRESIEQTDIQKRLKSASCRFWRIRGRYIFSAINRLKDFSLAGEINRRADNPYELREFIVSEFDGIGYKASSHFLRNIGIFGLAILDKHILNSMVEFGVMREIPAKMEKPEIYKEVEKKFQDFARVCGLTVEELDLLLWSRKAGMLIK
ncbi:MAG: hypothetical protein ACPL6C_01750 [bacterium]